MNCAPFQSKLVSLLFLFSISFLPVLNAQTWEAGLGTTFRDYYGIPYGEISSSRLYPALNASIGRYLNPSFSLELIAGIGFNDKNYPAGALNFSKMLDIDARIHYKLNNGYMLKEDVRIAPYFIFGLGSNKTEDKINHSVPWGVGARIAWTERVSLNFNGVYKPSFTKLRSYMTFNASVMYHFGKKIFSDKDGDGVEDAIDRCPYEQGTRQTYGCPDLDNDGVVDRFDQCPEMGGPAHLRGCPEEIAYAYLKEMESDKLKSEGMKKDDNDGDGILNTIDDCPDHFGTQQTGGCPDKDGDKLADKDDACPGEYGNAATGGCPDIDGDAIADKSDACPEVAGIPSLNGCPELNESLKVTFKMVTESIRFHTGQNTLWEDSYQYLDYIVEEAKRYPAYTVVIKGYTDDIGNEENNKRLSELRATACANYIMSRGISKDRLQVIGYGEQNPVAPNTSEEGRAQNRRIEFDFVLTNTATTK